MGDCRKVVVEMRYIKFLPCISVKSKIMVLKIRMYDKDRELKEHSPEKRPVINSWLGFNYDKLYRIEAEITNVSMRELCAILNNFDIDYFHDDRILSFLFDEKFLFQLLNMALHKVVYWREKKM